jgi:hypothetical protein
VPPIRPHDLRHGAASLAYEAGADLKTLPDLLGHSSIVITADTYTSVLPTTQRRCADATAKLVLAAARRTRDKIRKKGRRNRPDSRPDRYSRADRPDSWDEAAGRVTVAGHALTEGDDTRVAPT